MAEVINCAGCIACCSWIKYPIERTRLNDEWARARGFRWMDGAYWIRNFCPRLSDEAGKGCYIYAFRPIACRTFRVGGADCLTCRKLENENPRP